MKWRLGFLTIIKRTKSLQIIMNSIYSSTCGMYYFKTLYTSQGRIKRRGGGGGGSFGFPFGLIDPPPPFFLDFKYSAFHFTTSTNLVTCSWGSSLGHCPINGGRLLGNKIAGRNLILSIARNEQAYFLDSIDNWAVFNILSMLNSEQLEKRRY